MAKQQYNGPVWNTPFGVIETYQDPPGFYCAHYQGDYDEIGTSDIDYHDAAIQLIAASTDRYYETGHTRPTKRS